MTTRSIEELFDGIELLGTGESVIGNVVESRDDQFSTIYVGAEVAVGIPTLPQASTSNIQYVCLLLRQLRLEYLLACISLFRRSHFLGLHSLFVSSGVGIFLRSPRSCLPTLRS